MKHFELIEIEEQPNGATYIWLNRPELHNAFNAQLIAELSQCFDALEQNVNTRVVILAAAAKFLCWRRPELDESSPSF